MGYMINLRGLLLTTLAILAFAGNSLLTRFGLAGTHMDAGQFAAIRLVSGALMLFVLTRRKAEPVMPMRADLAGIFALFVYAETTTYASLTLNAATGTLILFGVVQLTLAANSAIRGAAPTGFKLAGVLIAFSGLVWMLLPRAVSPPLFAGLLMALSGASWGLYTIAGRVPGDPIVRTARNFIGAGALTVIWLIGSAWTLPPAQGVLSAMASGAITSAIGYTIWYYAMPYLNVTTAGAAQLLVPVVVAAGAALWLGEQISTEVTIAGVIILGGIGLTLTGRRAAP